MDRFGPHTTPDDAQREPTNSRCCPGCGRALPQDGLRPQQDQQAQHHLLQPGHLPLYWGCVNTEPGVLHRHAALGDDGCPHERRHSAPAHVCTLVDTLPAYARCITPTCLLSTSRAHSERSVSSARDLGAAATAWSDCIMCHKSSFRLRSPCIDLCIGKIGTRQVHTKNCCLLGAKISENMPNK
jgi:hypothetical protein